MFDLWSLLQALDGFMMVALLDGTIVYLSESVHKHLGLFQVSIPGHNPRSLTYTWMHVYTFTHMHTRNTCKLTHAHTHTYTHETYAHSHIRTSHIHTRITPHHTLTHITVGTHRFQHVRPDSWWGLWWSKGSHRESWDIRYGQTILKRCLHSQIELQFSSP